MKKALFACLILLIAGFAILDHQRPTEPVETWAVVVLTLKNAPQGNGHRIIGVRMPGGIERTIETLTPFYYRPGDTAYLARFDRQLFPDIYDFVSEAR